MADNSEHLLVLSTCPGSITAKKIANELVANQLAACVQVLPGVQSFFRWVGKVDHKEEHLLLIKTTRGRLEALQERVRALHPYELPEVVAVPISGGLPGYLAWITACTEPAPD